MKENVIFYKCPICGNIIGLIEGDMQHITCCGKPMEEMLANTTEVLDVNNSDIKYLLQLNLRLILLKPHINLKQISHKLRSSHQLAKPRPTKSPTITIQNFQNIIPI